MRTPTQAAMKLCFQTSALTKYNYKIKIILFQKNKFCFNIKKGNIVNQSLHIQCHKIPKYPSILQAVSLRKGCPFKLFLNPPPPPILLVSLSLKNRQQLAFTTYFKPSQICIEPTRLKVKFQHSSREIVEQGRHFLFYYIFFNISENSVIFT